MQEGKQCDDAGATIEMEIYQEDIRNCYALSVDKRIETIVDLTSDIEELLGLQPDKEYRMQRVQLFRQQAVINFAPVDFAVPEAAVVDGRGRVRECHDSVFLSLLQHARCVAKVVHDSVPAAVRLCAQVHIAELGATCHLRFVM